MITHLFSMATITVALLKALLRNFKSLLKKKFLKNKKKHYKYFPIAPIFMKKLMLLNNNLQR